MRIGFYPLSIWIEVWSYLQKLLALFLWCWLLLLIFCKGGFFWFFGCTKSVAIEIKAPHGSCWAISSCRVVYYTLKHDSTFWVWEWNPLSSYFLWWRRWWKWTLLTSEAQSSNWWHKYRYKIRHKKDNMIA